MNNPEHAYRRGCVDHYHCRDPGCRGLLHGLFEFNASDLPLPYFK